MIEVALQGFDAVVKCKTQQMSVNITFSGGNVYGVVGGFEMGAWALAWAV